MRNKPSSRTIVLIWLGWVVAMLGYQAFVTARMGVARPDYSRSWTPDWTLANSQDGKIYLTEPFLNTAVSWDSEYYLAIAIGGYEDPNIGRVGEQLGPVMTGGGFWPFVIPEVVGGVQQGTSRSHAFFPFYPFMIRVFSWPLSLLGLNPIATATLAGVVVSMLGTLAAMLSLFQLAKDQLGEEGGLRAAFYLLIFPSGFFLAQVYTEGLFVGLAFTSLMLLYKGHRGWAAVLAVCATFTRAVGVTLVIPLLLSWIDDWEWMELDLEWRQLYLKGIPWKAIGHLLVVLSPALFFQIWRMSYYGLSFSRVEEVYFGRGLLSLGSTYASYSNAIETLFNGNPQAAAYHAVEIGAAILGFVACIAWMRRQRALAWFGLLVVLLSFTSGDVQGIYRYILGAPPVFLYLSQLGQKPAFDRVWTVVSVLVMGVMATMFMFDMWAG